MAPLEQAAAVAAPVSTAESAALVGAIAAVVEAVVRERRRAALVAPVPRAS
jgi:hypothetical protein